tara:strand:+ start:5579 stop:5818 length:240 start_codon:yes stop_codon:yes gene_type:complete
MDHKTLKMKIRKSFGSAVPFAAKDSWSKFVAQEKLEYWLRYEWVKDPRFFEWVTANSETLDAMDGEEWFGVVINNDTKN